MNVLLIETDRSAALAIQGTLKAYERDHPGRELGLCWVSTREALVEALIRYTWTAIICDYSPPDMPWPEVLRIARQYSPKLPVIITSGSATDDQGIDAIRDGAADYVDMSNLDRLGHVIVREAIHAEAYNRLMETHTRIQNGDLPVSHE